MTDECNSPSFVQINILMGSWPEEIICSIKLPKGYVMLMRQSAVAAVATEIIEPCHVISNNVVF